MKREDAAAYAADMLERHGLDGWRVTFNGRKTALGVCTFSRRTIGLSGPLVDRNGLDVYADVIAHEVAHALAGPGTGHGPSWRAACRRTGAVPRACADAESVVSVPAPWAVVCPTCGPICERYKRSTRAMCCGRCGARVSYERKTTAA
jgi:predicted SprT family Zn-dependent metalloprotease